MRNVMVVGKLTKNVAWPMNASIENVRYMTLSLTQGSSIPIPIIVRNGPPKIQHEPSNPNG